MTSSLPIFSDGCTSPALTTPSALSWAWTAPDDSEESNRYTRAAALLDEWLDSGVLRHEDCPPSTCSARSSRTAAVACSASRSSRASAWRSSPPVWSCPTSSRRLRPRRTGTRCSLQRRPTSAPSCRCTATPPGASPACSMTWPLDLRWRRRATKTWASRYGESRTPRRRPPSPPRSQTPRSTWPTATTGTRPRSSTATSG